MNRIATTPTTPPRKIILSASRRTDIPAFYMPWFMDRIERGVFEVENPYNGHITRVPATPEAVHAIVFWSKDFGPFLEGGYGEALRRWGYHLLFNFTVNSARPELEPGVPPLEARLDQMAALCKQFSPRTVLWRFDPICRYEMRSGVRDNLGDFDWIAERAARSGIERCITSFLDLYPKIRKRTERLSGLRFLPHTPEEQREIILELKAQLALGGVALYTCCEGALLESLPPETGIRPSACIPGRLIIELFGGNISLRRDPGQRAASGCRCTLSSDIGSYKDHPCHHNCLFCYANPAAYRTAAGGLRRPAESAMS